MIIIAIGCGGAYDNYSYRMWGGVLMIIIAIGCGVGCL